MHSSLKRLSLIGTSAALLFAAFVGGYYVATLDRGSFVSVSSADESLDLGEFWRVLDVVRERYVAKGGTAEVSDEELMRGAIRGMVDALGDPYTVYMDPKESEDFATEISGSFDGIGAEIGDRTGSIVVVTPMKGSPSEKAGLRAGDVILKIGATSTSGMTVDQAVGLIRGPKGTTVTLRIGREGVSDAFDLTIKRDTIAVPTVETEKRADGVFVIRLYTFNQQANRLFKQALKEFVLAKTDKLVLDLRGNPGGYLDSAVDISSWFLPAGKLVVTEDFGREEPDEEFRSKGYELFGDGLKMVVLVDAGSASASEIVAGALQDHDVAKIVGAQTFGKGSVQTLVDLDDGASLKVTIARWLTPDGRSISDGGLTPDVEVKFDRERYEKDKYDTQLEAAAQILIESR